tara:strand:+ start:7067 stop:8884 length:1818 start_codon:yes stop_codon:yes gene_type:complete
MARFFFIKHKNSDEFKILNLKKKINSSRKSKIFQIHKTVNKIFSYILSDNIEDSSKLFEDEHYLCIIDGSPHYGKKLYSSKDFLTSYLNKTFKNFLKNINGGYVGFIFNKKKKETISFRDRFGLKPIYYYNKNDILVLSSQSDYINTYFNNEIDLNYNYIYRYAYSNYKSIYGREETMFKDVKMQKISSIYAFKNKNLFKSIYWDLDPTKKISTNTLDQHSNKIIQIFKDMIFDYESLNKDKISAVALSGGMDSGLISGLLNKYFKKPNAVSLTYLEDSEFNEEKLIKESVKKNIDKWDNFKLQPSHLLKDLNSNFYEHYDAPLATISIYGYNYLFKSASLLGYDLLYTGSGGDYIQSGNYTNYWYYLADLYFNKDKLFERELNFWIKYHSTSEYPKSFDIFKKEIIKKVNLNKYGKLAEQNLVFDQSILNKNAIKNSTFLNSKVVKNYGSYLRSFMMQEYVYDAVAPGVEAEDTMEWINNISLQSPFFDKEIAEFGWILPSHLKITNGVNKSLYRKVFTDILPSKIINRTAKSGFNAPFDQWVRKELKDFLMDIFKSQLFKNRSIYNYKQFMQLVDDHMTNKSNHMMLLWQALNLELWLRDKNR